MRSGLISFLVWEQQPGLPILIKIGMTGIDSATLTKSRGQLRMTFIGFDGFGELLTELHTQTHYQIRPEVDAGDTDTFAAHC